MEEELMNNLSRKAALIGINLTNEQKTKFFTYMKLLIEWNEKINLTAITEPNDIILKHFIDSLSIYSYIKEQDNILDIGSGAGFPGIPIKIVCKKNGVTLLDSLNKRINFLQIVIESLKLENAHAIHGRAEEFIKEKNNREGFKVVTSRAVAKLNTLIEYMLPFTQIGGKCICMKSQEIDEELKEAEKAIKILGGEIESVDTIVLPESDIKRKIVVIKKVSKTPEKYPRKPGMPAKEPIN